jgi:hypothetical protein
MSDFFSKVPTEEVLLELLKKKDFKSILNFAKPLNPKSSMSRALSFLQTTDQHDNEFRLYMAYIMSKLNTEDLLETLDEYIADVTTVSERRDLFFWKAKNLGVISDLFEKELSKYQTLLKFLFEVTKENRSKYLNLHLAKETGTSALAASTLASLKQDTKQSTFFAKRILCISPVVNGAFEFAKILAGQLGAYHIEMKTEFVKVLGNPIAAFQLGCELAKKYQPLMLTYQDFSQIDHQTLDALFLQQTPAEGAPNTYLLALSQNPIEIYRETFEQRWFQKAIFLSPSTPQIRQDHFKKNSLTKNFEAGFLAAQSSFYSIEEIDHLIRQLPAPDVKDIVKILHQSQPRYQDWLLNTAFLKTWTYYPLWEEITNYNAIENDFRDKTKERLKNEFLEDRLALQELIANPFLLLTGNTDPFLRFINCRKQGIIPADILENLLELLSHSNFDDDAQKKIFSFIVFTQSPSPEALDLTKNGKIFQFSLKNAESAEALLSTGHSLSNEQLLQLAETFQTENAERKIMYYIERFKADDFDLIFCLTSLFKNFRSQFLAIQALRKTIDREKNPVALEKLFSLLLFDFTAKPESRKLWTSIVREFNAANNERNFDQILGLNKSSEKIYHLNLKSLLQLVTNVMNDPELMKESETIHWILTMLGSTSSDFEEIDTNFKNHSAHFLKNTKIGINDRVQFLKALLDWKIDQPAFQSWIQEITSDIPFSKIGWADLKDHPRLRSADRRGFQ